jgi:hypothetical protein
MRIRMLLALVLLLATVPALAADYYVDITNRTGFIITHVYVSPGSSKSWEEDVLGTEVLPVGETRRVNLRGYTSPIFDIRLVDSDGDTYTYMVVDVSQRDIIATLEHLDK